MNFYPLGKVRLRLFTHISNTFDQKAFEKTLIRSAHRPVHVAGRVNWPVDTNPYAYGFSVYAVIFGIVSMKHVHRFECRFLE